jgi:hypothetical protein
MSRLLELRQSKERLMRGLAGMEPLQHSTEEVIAQIKELEKEIRAELAYVPEPILVWPMSEEEVAQWCWSRPWQFAHTLWRNPHEHYVGRKGDRLMFERIVLYLREHGYRYKWGRSEYVQIEVDGSAYWTMGADLESTVLINRKPVALARHDEKIRRAGARRLS